MSSKATDSLRAFLKQKHGEQLNDVIDSMSDDCVIIAFNHFYEIAQMLKGVFKDHPYADWAKFIEEAEEANDNAIDAMILIE